MTRRTASAKNRNEGVRFGRCEIVSFSTPTPSRKSVMIVAHVIPAKKDHESAPDCGIGLSFLQIVLGERFFLAAHCRVSGGSDRAEDGGRRKKERGDL